MRIQLTFDIPDGAAPKTPETSATVVQTETGYAVWLRPADNYVTGAGAMRQAHCKSTLPEALIVIAEHLGATYDPDADVGFGDDEETPVEPEPSLERKRLAARNAIAYLHQFALTLRSHCIPAYADELREHVDEAVRALRQHVLQEATE